MRIKKPLSKEAYEHFSNKLKRREKFSSEQEKKKMIERCEKYDRGFRDNGSYDIERG